LTNSIVVRGLNPRIHLHKETMDCRVEPGNDFSLAAHLSKHEA
jgi:hypothetical protein